MPGARNSTPTIEQVMNWSHFVTGKEISRTFNEVGSSAVEAFAGKRSIGTDA
jgi:hypothetical protein